MDAIVARQDNHHKTLQTERLHSILRCPSISDGRLSYQFSSDGYIRRSVYAYDYCLFCCSPAYAFSGRPPGGAGCRERSQRSCLRPGGLPSLTRNPGLAATVSVAPPLSRRGLRSLHPGKRPPGCKAQRRFANRASRRCGGSRNSTDDGG